MKNLSKYELLGYAGIYTDMQLSRVTIGKRFPQERD